MDLRAKACVLRFQIWFLIPWLASLGSCSQSDNDPKPPPPGTKDVVGKGVAWTTSGDQSKLLTESEFDLTISKTTDHPTVVLDTATVLQEIEGFGAALTGSSAYLINKKLSGSQRAALLTDLFDPENGIGISYLRMTIGASDFSLSDFTYDDVPAGETDFDLSEFSLAQDLQDVVPVFRQIMSIAPDVKIMGSPWSPPAWMKTNGNLRGGKLKTDAYQVYAQYFVKYIRAYQQEGIPIDAVTPQNEPLHFTASYPSMEMQPEEQLNFIRNHLGPLFQSEGIPTKIVVYDHNWDNTAYPMTILNDPVAKSFVAGSAFHAYAGNVSAMSTVHNAHPDKRLYFTEISGGEWATDFGDNLQWNMANIFIGTMKNWSGNALLWNLALDENHGPKNNGCQDCRGVVTISSSGTVTKNVEYYSIGHFSKFVRKGAHRISSTDFGSSTQLDHVGFMNADGSKVAVVSNSGDQQKTFTIKAGARQIIYTLSGKSVVTLVWN